MTMTMIDIAQKAIELDIGDPIPPAPGPPSTPSVEAGAGDPRSILTRDQQRSISHKWRRGGPKDDRIHNRS